jgi:tRNA dimethylallyltransferase
METKLNTAIHQFAKRQMTWFRKMEREGYLINWINGKDNEKIKIQKALEIINNPA